MSEDKKSMTFTAPKSGLYRFMLKDGKLDVRLMQPKEKNERVEGNYTINIRDGFCHIIDLRDNDTIIVEEE